MSLTTSYETARIAQTPINQNDRDYVRVVNPDGSIDYKPRVRYQQPTVIHRSYHKALKPKYNYTVEQDGKTYRCCQWCRACCSKKCPSCDFCDRIVACPLLFFMLAALLLLLLFIALLTLFGLHPSINASRRYYGIISKLSITNNTKYIYNLDSLCNQYGVPANCFNIITSTDVVNVGTTIVTNRTIITMNYSYILLLFCLIIYCIFQKI